MKEFAENPWENYFVPAGTKMWIWGPNAPGDALFKDTYNSMEIISTKDVYYSSEDLLAASKYCYSFKLPPNKNQVWRIDVPTNCVTIVNELEHAPTKK